VEANKVEVVGSKRRAIRRLARCQRYYTYHSFIHVYLFWGNCDVEVGKHRITDVPRINRNDRRSPIYFHNNYANNKKSSHKGGQQQPLIFDGGKYFMPNNEEITNNIVDQDNNKYIINNNNNSSFYSGRPTKYGRQKSIDSATSLMHTGKSLRFLTKPMDRSGGGFKERRGGGGNNS
jgi:hypothetical protein